MRDRPRSRSLRSLVNSKNHGPGADLLPATEVLSVLIASARLGKKYAGGGTIQRREFNKIIRVATQLRREFSLSDTGDSNK